MKIEEEEKGFEVKKKIHKMKIEEEEKDFEEKKKIHIMKMQAGLY